MTLNALDNQGNPVDWWFMYKVARNSEGEKVHGTEFIYFDSNDEKNNGKLRLVPQTVDKNGALVNTLNQIYTTTSPHVGWCFYNDEDPIKKTVNSERGHAKGVLAFDLATNTAFWLILSIPLFPLQGAYGYPDTGLDMAQTLLCITLKDATVAQSIANQMFLAHHPNVFLASKIPQGLDPKDPRALILSNQVDTSMIPYTHVLPFTSKAGKQFTCIAKNRHYQHSFYNDLVGPTLHANLIVETWEHDPTPPPEGTPNHQVVAMKSVNLSPLQQNVLWSEESDHAKLAISAPNEAVHWICVGDLNFTKPQDFRSGGTVAFQCHPLWQGIQEILQQTASPPKKS
jgi:deoxyribonuclease-2